MKMMLDLLSFILLKTKREAERDAAFVSCCCCRCCFFFYSSIAKSSNQCLKTFANDNEMIQVYARIGGVENGNHACCLAIDNYTINHKK